MEESTSHIRDPWDAALLALGGHFDREKRRNTTSVQSQKENAKQASGTVQRSMMPNKDRIPPTLKTTFTPPIVTPHQRPKTPIAVTPTSPHALNIHKYRQHARTRYVGNGSSYRSSPAQTRAQGGRVGWLGRIGFEPDGCVGEVQREG